jgi:hypothetical protein
MRDSAVHWILHFRKKINIYFILVFCSEQPEIVNFPQNIYFILSFFAPEQRGIVNFTQNRKFHPKFVQVFLFFLLHQIFTKIICKPIF